MIIYGLSTCSDCQKAQKALEAAGNTITFRDVRAEPLTEAELEELLIEFGDRLVDRTTNDYRALNTWGRLRLGAESYHKAFPTFAASCMNSKGADEAAFCRCG